MLGDEGARALAAPEQALELHRPEGLAKVARDTWSSAASSGSEGRRVPAGALPVDPLLELVLDRDRAQPWSRPGCPLWPLHSGEEYTSDNSARVKELDSVWSAPYHPAIVQ